MSGFRNFGHLPPGRVWQNLGGNIYAHDAPLQIAGQTYPYGGMVIGHKPLRGPWNKPWTPKPLNQKQIGIAQTIAASRAQEQAKRQMEQAQARARAQKEAQERATRERQREEQQKRLREQLQREKNQEQIKQDELLRREREQRQRDLREQQLRRERERIQQLQKRPVAKFEQGKPPSWFHNVYAKIKGNTMSDNEAFERVFGPRMESAKKQDLLKNILTDIYGTAYGYGIGNSPFVLKKLITSGQMSPTFVRGLTYQQEINKAGNEYQLLIDMVQRTGPGGAGVLEFPAVFQRLANILGKPVRAGFHSNVKAGSVMEKLLSRIGHTTKEAIELGKEFRGFFTKVYYPK